MSHDRSTTLKAKSVLPPSEFVQVHGVLALNGDRQQCLSLNEKKRSQFLSTTTNTLFLLTSSPSNPLFEEGEFEILLSRERKGEYFIPPVALTLLIARDIKKYQECKDDDIYNTKNIFIINGNTSYEGIFEILSSLRLAPGEDAKIIYIQDLHPVAFYLRNDAGKVRCYIADSLGLTSQTIQILGAIRFSLGKIDVVLGPDLQRDYDSCATIAKKSMMYFIKHGKEIFAHIDKVGTTPSQYGRQLSLENLMPALLKLSQVHPVSLPTSALNTVVSVKSKTTLGEYLSEKKIEIDGRTFNTAAVQAKYKYFLYLHEMLAQPKIDKQILKIATTIYSCPADLRRELAVAKAAINKENKKNKKKRMLILGGLVAIVGAGLFAAKKMAEKSAPSMESGTRLGL